MSLTSVARRLTPAELAREPRHLGVIAYFDGWAQATGLPPATYPRLITEAEAEHWREGWNEAKAAEAEQAAHEQTPR